PPAASRPTRPRPSPPLRGPPAPAPAQPRDPGRRGGGCTPRSSTPSRPRGTATDTKGGTMGSDASRIYTKTGDDGTTGRLFGGRIGKDDPLVDACGDIDEAIGALGQGRAELAADPDATDLAALTLATQRQLFVVAADLMANPHQREELQPGISLVDDDLVARIEQDIDDLVEQHPLKPVF